MKDEIHPEYHQATVHCNSCGTSFVTGSTLKDIRVNVCSACHPFYTGKAKLLDTEGRVDRFRRKYAKNQDAKAPAAQPAAKA